MHHLANWPVLHFVEYRRVLACSFLMANKHCLSYCTDLETDFTTVASMDDGSVDAAAGAPSNDPDPTQMMGTMERSAASTTTMNHNNLEMVTDCTEVVLQANGEASILTVVASNHDSNTLSLTQDAANEPCWAQRLERDEVFSSRYRLSVTEEQELQDLDVELGLRPKPGGMPRFWGRRTSASIRLTEAQKLAWQHVARPVSAADPQQQQPSFILKRGTCWLQPNPQSNEKEVDSAMQEQCECQVILLTRGWVIALASSGTRSTVTDPPSAYHFHNAWTWNQVEFVQPTQRGFVITLEKKTNTAEINSQQQRQQQPQQRQQYTFSCANLQHQQDWMDAFHTILVQYHTHNISPSHSSNHYVLGWQYQHVYRPGFTVAVTNCVTPDLEALDRSNAKQLNIIDDYHGYAPLHYAVKCHHVPAIVSLLQHHSNIQVDVLDADGHTPLYLAVQDEAPLSTRQLLLDHGARPITDVGPRGELFGKVAATELILEERQREKQQEQQAKAAQAEIANNMKLLQRRGEQINELNDKASDLNQGAADFASMAKHLKAAAQKKKWYQL